VSALTDDEYLLTRRRDQPRRASVSNSASETTVDFTPATNSAGTDIDADGLTAGGEGFDECGATTGVGSSMRSPAFVKAWAARTVEAVWKRSILNS
jgi:hypothetical protein